MGDIKNRFTYHKPSADQIPKFEQLRAKARELAELFEALVPSSREQSLAVTHLDAALMWANAGVARNQEGEEHGS